MKHGENTMNNAQAFAQALVKQAATDIIATRHGLTEDQRYDLANTPVTLNGEPAQIAGVKLPFAGVRNLKTGESYQWAWETVARIVANGGDFRS